MLRVLEQAFFVGRGGADDVVTWLDGTPGQIEDGSFGRDFPLNFISSNPDGLCNAKTTVSLLTLKLALRVALIQFSFFVSSFENSSFYMHKHNISFPCVIPNKNLIIWFDSFDKICIFISLYAAFKNCLCSVSFSLLFYFQKRLNNFIYTQKN